MSKKFLTTSKCGLVEIVTIYYSEKFALFQRYFASNDVSQLAMKYLILCKNLHSTKEKLFTHNTNIK